jgi:hypothetical protein
MVSEAAKLQAELERLLRLRAWVNDKLTQERLAQLIKETEERLRQLEARREIVMHDEANKLRAALRRLRAQLSRTMNIQMRMTLSGNIMQMEERLRELEEATVRSE